jgi:hypothetical protein
MKTQVTLIARNKQGASVEFKGKSKAEALRNFKFVYNSKGWRFEYIDSYGNKPKK